MKSVFFAILIASLFYGLFPAVFKPQENYTKNISRYLDDTRLQLYVVQNFASLAQPPISDYFFDTVFTADKKIQTVSKRYLDTASYLYEIDFAIDSAFRAINNYSDLILTMDENKVKGINEMYQSLNSVINASRLSLIL